jgi:uncharacterized membrane protein YeaQ/YmgE (transglycosylase-associated protein family)
MGMPHWFDRPNSSEVLDAWEDPGGIFITMALGIARSIGATTRAGDRMAQQKGQSAGFLMSVLGAVLLL